MTSERLAFSSTRDGGQSDIFVLDLQTNETTNLTNDPGGDFYPAWSPDGTKIAFTSNRAGAGEASLNIWVMNADGTNQVQLTTRVNGVGGGAEPAWSPDGTKIAFIGEGSMISSDIFVMNADGTNQINIQNDTVADHSPAWSPDGSQITFHRFIVAVGHNIFTMNADGSNQTAVTNLMNLAVLEMPVWSSDDKILFALDQDNNYEIYAMDPSGANQTRITTSDGTDSEPDLSTDASKIAFSTNRDGNFEIYMMSADGTNPINLTNNAADDVSPAWLVSR